MLPADSVLLREIPVIQKIIQDETWLEGERRGCTVAPTDQVVREHVCEVILRIGQQLRESLTATSTTDAKCFSEVPNSVTTVNETAQQPGLE